MFRDDLPENSRIRDPFQGFNRRIQESEDSRWEREVGHEFKNCVQEFSEFPGLQRSVASSHLDVKLNVRRGMTSGQAS